MTQGIPIRRLCLRFVMSAEVVGAVDVLPPFNLGFSFRFGLDEGRVAAEAVFDG